jgi:hypothetical protein
VLRSGGIEATEEWLCIEENTPQEDHENIPENIQHEDNCPKEKQQPVWRPKPIDPKQFYSEPDIKWKIKLALLSKPPNDKEMQKSNTTVYHIGRVFYKQDEAFKYLDSHFDAKALHVFAFEQESFHGGRKYLVCAYNDFWRHYKRLPENERHFYELIREGTPCCLYFDLEYKKELNKDLVTEELVDTLIQYLTSAIKDSFQIDVSRESIVDLDSSSSDKFSRHLIFKSVVFRNNIYCGNFVKYMCGKISFECQTKRPEELLPGLEKLLIVNDKGNKAVFIDPAVYSRNRIFRVYKSSKLGKNTPLVVSQSNKFPYVKEKQLFLASLVCTVGNKPVEQTLLFDDISSLIYGKLPESSSPSKKSTVLKGDRLNEFEHSPFPEIDRFVANSLRQRKGGRGYLRSWVYFKEALLLVYSIGGNRFCENINREHKSNHIMLVADFGSKIVYQKCHDPDCHIQNFKGSPTIIPDELMPEEIKHQIAEQNAINNTNNNNNPNNCSYLTEQEEQFWNEVDYEAEFAKIETATKNPANNS